MLESENVDWIGLNRPRIRSSGGILWTRWWILEFHKRLGISWLSDQLLTSEEIICSIALDQLHSVSVHCLMEK